MFALAMEGFVGALIVAEDPSESSDPLLLLHLDQNSDAALYNTGHCDNAPLVSFVVPGRTLLLRVMSTEVCHARDLTIDRCTQGLVGYPS